MIRIGHGFDVHRFGGEGPIIIGGVKVYQFAAGQRQPNIRIISGIQCHVAQTWI